MRVPDLFTDVEKVQEGVFLYKEGLSPFDGGVYHQVRTRNSCLAEL